MKKEEGQGINEQVKAENPASVKGVVKEATPKDAEKKAKEQERLSKQQMAMLQKRAALELADYKKRLVESVNLKRLQVEEIELNIAYYKAKKEYASIEKEIAEMEAKDLAEQQKAEAEAKVIPIKQGVPRTEEEIKESKV